MVLSFGGGLEMKKSLFLSAIIAICSFVSNPLFAVCPTQPDCASMGFTMSTTDCSGATTIRCPFDPSNNNAVFCHKISGGSTCDTNVKDLYSERPSAFAYSFSSDGACSLSHSKCYINSQVMFDNSSGCTDSATTACTNGIGDDNAYLSFASAGCEASSDAQLQTVSGDFYIGNNVYSEVPLNYYGAVMKGSAILKGDGNALYIMHLYDDYSSYQSSLSGGYNGGAIVLAGNTTITTLYLETTKNVPLLVGDDSGKSVLLELYGIMASSTKGQLCIGLRPGGSVLVAGGTTTYNDVVSTKKEITAPGSGYYSSNPVVIATAEVCLGAAGGTEDSTSCDTSYYNYTSCDSTNIVCDKCTGSNGTYYHFNGCRVQTNTKHDLGGTMYCCDETYYKYESCPEGANCTTCGKWYGYNSCLEGWYYQDYNNKCCSSIGGC